MAKILTPEQREQKRQRDAAYRARKAAQKNLTDQVFKVKLDSKVEDAIADALNGKISLTEFGAIAAANPGIETTPVTAPVADPLRAAVLTAQLGDSVTAPVTGMEAVVQKTFRGGGRLLTEDGEHMWANQCPHSTEEREAKGTVIFYEMVGLGNKDFADGTTGNVHRFSRCNKVIL